MHERETELMRGMHVLNLSLSADHDSWLVPVLSVGKTDVGLLIYQGIFIEQYQDSICLFSYFLVNFRYDLWF